MQSFKKFIPWIILGILVLWAVGGYNGLVNKEQEVNRTWADVESDYQRRMDLIPNLVNTVKGYANFEKETLILPLVHEKGRCGPHPLARSFSSLPTTTP